MRVFDRKEAPFFYWRVIYTKDPIDLKRKKGGAAIHVLAKMEFRFI